MCFNQAQPRLDCIRAQEYAETHTADVMIMTFTLTLKSYSLYHPSVNHPYVNCMAVTASLLFQCHEGVIFSLFISFKTGKLSKQPKERQSVLYLLLYGKSPHSQKQRPCRTCTVDKCVSITLLMQLSNISHRKNKNCNSGHCVRWYLWSSQKGYLPPAQATGDTSQFAGCIISTGNPSEYWPLGETVFSGLAFNTEAVASGPEGLGARHTEGCDCCWITPSWPEEHIHINVSLTGQF